MLKIRLTRRGKKNRPFFRIVVAEASAPIKGRFIEILGYVDPVAKKRNVNKERVLYWLEAGAQTSPTVHNLLVTEGVIKATKINKFVAPKKKKQTGSATTPQAETKPKAAEAKIEQTKPEEEKPILPENPTSASLPVQKNIKPKEKTVTVKEAVKPKKVDQVEEKVKPLPTESAPKK